MTTHKNDSWSSNFFLLSKFFHLCITALWVRMWVHHFDPDWNISKAIAWVAVKSCTSIRGRNLLALASDMSLVQISNDAHTINPHPYSIPWHLCWCQQVKVSSTGWINMKFSYIFCFPKDESSRLSQNVIYAIANSILVVIDCIIHFKLN